MSMLGKQLTVRIGTQRTGSRYIESLLEDVRPRLREYGIWLPKEPYYFGEALRNSGSVGSVPPAETDQGLLAYEAFVGIPGEGYGDTAKGIECLRNYGAEWGQTRIVLFVRHQLEFIHSWWGLEHNQRSRKTFPEFIKTFPIRAFDWCALAEQWEAAFDAFIVHWEQRITGDNFMRLLGFDCDITTTKQGSPHARVPKSRKQGFTLEQAIELWEFYEPSNRRLAERYGLKVDTPCPLPT